LNNLYTNTTSFFQVGPKYRKRVLNVHYSLTMLSTSSERIDAIVESLVRQKGNKLFQEMP